MLVGLISSRARAREGEGRVHSLYLSYFPHFETLEFVLTGSLFHQTSLRDTSPSSVAITVPVNLIFLSLDGGTHSVTFADIAASIDQRALLSS